MLLTMLPQEIKKQIIYRCLHTGTKETDILFKKFFIKKIDFFDKSELELIISMFDNFTDLEILMFLKKNNNPPDRYRKLLKKLINE
tara:strand:- start:265 stop:522 length:258 start_codon:yes stop_codon:yes gene_type:complete